MPPASRDSKGREFVAKARRYGRVLRWFLADAMRRFGVRVVVILATGFVAVTLEVTAIGLAVKFAQMLKKDGGVTLLGRELSARHSPLLLVGFAGAVLVTLAVSALLNYYSRTRILLLRRSFEIACAARALLAIGSSGTPAPLPDMNGDVPSDGMMLRVIRRDARYCGRILIAIITGIVPGITLGVAIVSLFLVDAPLTLGLGVLLGVSGIFQYRASVGGARASIRVEAEADEAAREYRRVLQRAKRCGAPLPGQEQWLLEHVFDRNHVRRYFEAYIRRLRATENSHLVSNMVFAVAIFAIMAVLGGRILRAGEGWDGLIIYIVALRYALVNLKTITTKATNVNRFYPQIRRFVEFVQETEASIAGAVAPAGEAPPLRVRPVTEPLPDTLAELHVQRGAPLGIVTDLAASRFALPALFGRLAGADAGALHPRAWFVAGKFPWLDRVSIRAWLALPEDFALDVPDLDMTLPDLDAALTSEQWDDLDPGAKLLLVAAIGRAQGREWFIIDGADLAASAEPARAALAALLSNAYVLTLYGPGLGGLGALGEQAFAVTGPDGVSAVASEQWCRDNREHITATVGAEAAAAGGGVDDEEDEDF